MVIAITAGIVLAAILFMKEIADMTRVVEITRNKQYVQAGVPENCRIFKITGPLFFAAADKIFSELTRYCERDEIVILYLDNVTMLDAGGLSALTKLITHCEKVGAQLMLTDVQFQPLKTLTKARIKPIEGIFRLYPRLGDALQPLTNS